MSTAIRKANIMPKTETILKVFVASPSDVAEERRLLEDVISELNATWSDTLGIRLDLVRWETHVTPGFGEDAQDVINDHIQDNYDIFIGIMWTRFGTPTKRAGSGTEEEFIRAHERYKEDPSSIEIMFYFKNSPQSISKLAPDQLQLISNFRSELGELGGLYWEFDTAVEFQNTTRIHLSRAVQRWNKRMQQNAGTVTLISQTRPSDDSTKELEEEGFIELIESAHDSIENVNEILDRMTEVTQDLGDKFQQRSEEASSISNLAGTPDLKAAKRVAANMARDLEDFVKRMNVEIPLYSDAFSTSMDSFSRAAAITTDFGVDNSDDLTEALDVISGFRTAMTEAMDGLEDFRDVVVNLPRMTTAFNRGRRSALATIDQLIEELNIGNRQTIDVELLLRELISQCQTEDETKGAQ